MNNRSDGSIDDVMNKTKMLNEYTCCVIGRDRLAVTLSEASALSCNVSDLESLAFWAALSEFYTWILKLASAPTFRVFISSCGTKLLRLRHQQHIFIWLKRFVWLWLWLQLHQEGDSSVLLALATCEERELVKGVRGGEWRSATSIQTGLIPALWKFSVWLRLWLKKVSGFDSSCGNKCSFIYSTGGNFWLRLS